MSKLTHKVCFSLLHFTKNNCRLSYFVANIINQDPKQLESNTGSLTGATDLHCLRYVENVDALKSMLSL